VLLAWPLLGVHGADDNAVEVQATYTRLCKVATVRHRKDADHLDVLVVHLQRTRPARHPAGGRRGEHRQHPVQGTQDRHPHRRRRGLDERTGRLPHQSHRLQGRLPHRHRLLGHRLGENPPPVARRYRLHTGHRGAIDDDGFVRITGRKKDIIVFSGGKNISPPIWRTTYASRRGSRTRSCMATAARTRSP
jgi:acyl-CoA synthetase (AMP-forming)/AMP-acid ligase II